MITRPRSYRWGRSLWVALMVCFSSMSYGQEIGEEEDLACVWEKIMRSASALEDEGDLAGAVEQTQLALALAQNICDTDLTIRSLLATGLLYMSVTNYPEMLSHWLKAKSLAERAQDMDALAEVYNYMASFHFQDGQHELMKKYLNKSLSIRERIGTTLDIGILLNNFGVMEQQFGNPVTALELYYRSLAVWQQLNNIGWQAVAYSHIGNCHRRMGNLDSAHVYLTMGMELVDDRDVSLNAVFFTALGYNYLERKEYANALKYCEDGFRSHSEQSNIIGLNESCECLSRVYGALGDHKHELYYFKQHIDLRDSIAVGKKIREITFMQVDHEFKSKQLADSLRNEQDKLQAELLYSTAISQERERRNMLLLSTFGVLILSGGLYHRLRFIRRSKALVQFERDRADRLLHNMLPSTIADELIRTGTAEAREFQQATILFTDFHSFTSITEQLGAKELVATIDTCFKAFDRILQKHGVEKIKTVGDCYMACGGVPDPVKGSAVDVVNAALDLQRYMEEHMRERKMHGRPAFSMRIGIHSGPVVAGIVGLHKFAYDIWGDTVNIAARMENTGEVGRVNISATTHELVKHHKGFRFVPRGMVKTKGKGSLQMYFAEDSSTVVPHPAITSVELAPAN